MTSAEQTQFNRFIAAGYPPEIATQLIARGAWLEVAKETTETIVDGVRRYREERNAWEDGRELPLQLP